MSVLKIRPNPCGSCLLHYVQQKAIRTRSAGCISWDGGILSLCGCCCHQRVKRVRKRQTGGDFVSGHLPGELLGYSRALQFIATILPPANLHHDGWKRERERERKRVGTGRDKVRKFFLNSVIAAPAFWLNKPCRVVKCYQRSGGTCCLHIQSRIRSIQNLTALVQSYIHWRR